MPIIAMDMHIRYDSGEDVGGQNLLTVGYPGPDRWGICSSNVGLYGLKGKFTYRERANFEGTTCYKEGSTTDVVLRLAIFRGGNIDKKDWKVGKGGEGEWANVPAPGVAKKFQWTIVSIDDSEDA